MRRYVSVSAEPPPGLAPLRGRTRVIALVVMLSISIVGGVAFAVLIRWLAAPSNTRLSSVLRVQVLTVLGIGELIAFGSVALHLYELTAPTWLRRHILAWIIHRMRRHHSRYANNSHDGPPRRQWLSVWSRTLKVVGITLFAYVAIGALIHAGAYFLSGSGSTLQRLISAFPVGQLQTVTALALLCFGARVSYRRDRREYEML